MKTSRVWTAVLAAAFVAVMLLASSASAAKTVVSSIGSPQAGVQGGLFQTPRGVAVNQSGAGGVPAGTFYVVDSGNDRVQRLSPAGAFVSAWGWGVKDGDAEFQICTVAASCHAGLTGAAAGQLNTPQGVAVDQATGTVYVSDQGNRRVDVFTAAGTFVGAFGWKVRVAGEAEALQFCTAASGCKVGSTGVNGGQFAAALGYLAVAPAGSPNAGNVYVANKTQRRVDELQPTVESGVVTGVSFVRGFGWDVATGGVTTFETCVTGTCKAPGAAGTGLGQFGTNSPSEVSVDSEGNVFALDAANKRIQKFSSAPAVLDKEFAAAALTGVFGAGELLNLAVDPSTAPQSRLLVSGKRSGSLPTNQVAVLELDNSGAAVQTHGPELTQTSATGLAVARSAIGGNIFLSTAVNGLLHGERVLNSTAPTVEAPDPIESHSATLRGAVVSDELEVKYRFEYSSDGTTWTKVPATDASVPASPGSVAVSQVATGLQANTEYQVRLVATRPAAGFAIASAPIGFTTTGSAPTVADVGPNSITDTSARLNGFVNPEGQDSSYRFEFVNDTQFQEDVALNGPGHGFDHAVMVPSPDAQIGSGQAALTLSQFLTGLQPSTLYHFRLRAVNPTDATIAGEQTFFTRATAESPPLAPRGYELVSAANTNGILPLPQMASSDGDRFAYYVFLPVPGSPNGTHTRFISSRSPDGSWSQVPFGAPPEDPELSLGDAPLLYSGGLAPAAFATVAPLDPDDQNKQRDIYLDMGEGEYVWLSRDPVFPVGVPQTEQMVELGNPLFHISPEGDRVYFTFRRNLLPTDASSGAALYEWDLNQQPADETQSLAINAAAGVFTLSFADRATGIAGTSAPIPVDASAAALEAALEALPSIGGLPIPGSVEVTGGPAGGAPFEIVFGGALAGQDVGQITVDTSGAGVAAGTELSCAGGPESGVTLAYQWLANGAPIAAATTSTYTVQPADAGMALQCQVTAANSPVANAGATQTSSPAMVTIAAPVPATAPPATSQTAIAQPEKSANLNGAANRELTCNAGSWTNEPASYTYQWYRNGVPLDSPTTTTATSSKRTILVAEQTPAAGFQCMVTAANAGGSLSLASTVVNTAPAPSPPAPLASASVAPPIVVGTVVPGAARNLSLVGVQPGQTMGFEKDSRLGSAFNEVVFGTVIDAVSRDGSRVAFQAPDAGNREHLYIRLDGERTIEASRGTPPVSSPFSVRYAGADSDGKVVFFTSSSKLTAGSSIGTESATSPADLYSYEVDTETLRDLTPMTVVPGEAGGAGVRRVYAVSDDGRRLYFTSTRKLQGLGAEGAANLYRLELDEHGAAAAPLDFIATIDPLEDDLGAVNSGGMNGAELWREAVSNSDGSIIAFRDRLPVVPGQRTGGFAQAFVYDAARDELDCISCPADGTTPSAGANLSPARPLIALEGEPDPKLVLNGAVPAFSPHIRGVAEDGTVVFQTATPLLAADRNDKIDVYQYRGGRLGLISSGTGGANSMVAGISADGTTAFFRSADDLVPGAEDGVQHIFAARVGSRYVPPPTPTPCVGDDCRAGVSAPPFEPQTGSTAFSGPGSPSLRTPQKGRADAKKNRPKGKKRRKRGKGKRHRRPARPDRRDVR